MEYDSADGFSARAESEFYAVEAPNVDRWETLDHRRKQDRRIGANPETRAEDVAKRAVSAVEEVPGTSNGPIKEVKCTRPVLVNPRSRGRESPDKMSPRLDTLENAKESPSDSRHEGPGKRGDAQPREQV